MNDMVESALELTSGQELERFSLGEVVISGRNYVVLTGYEGTGGCFWCGEPLKGKLKRYCYGHMKEYYRHFEWNSARYWCCQRQGWICANCGGDYSSPLAPALEVHHIVPLLGGERYFSAFNLPWNLIGLCHECHQLVHAVMKDGARPAPKDMFERAIAMGQGVFSYFEDISRGGLATYDGANRERDTPGHKPDAQV